MESGEILVTFDLQNPVRITPIYTSPKDCVWYGFENWDQKHTFINWLLEFPEVSAINGVGKSTGEKESTYYLRLSDPGTDVGRKNLMVEIEKRINGEFEKDRRKLKNFLREHPTASQTS